MFFKTLNVTKLKENLGTLGEITGRLAMQIIHKGHDIKVVITQERYFELLAAESLLKNSDVRGPEYVPFSEIGSKIKKTMKEWEATE